MTNKRKLLLCYIVSLGCAALLLLVLFPMLAYPKLRFIPLLIISLVSLPMNFLLRKYLHPFPRHRLNFSSYGLAGRICGAVMVVGLIGGIAVLVYYGFNYKEQALFACAFGLMLGLIVFWIIFTIYDQYRFAAEKDKNEQIKMEVS